VSEADGLTAPERKRGIFRGPGLGEGRVGGQWHDVLRALESATALVQGGGVLVFSRGCRCGFGSAALPLLFPNVRATCHGKDAHRPTLQQQGMIALTCRYGSGYPLV